MNIYETCLRTIMTYAGETMGNNTETKKILTTTEMKILRNIRRHSLTDRKENKKI